MLLKMGCELPKSMNPDALLKLLVRIVLLVLQYFCRKQLLLVFACAFSRIGKTFGEGSMAVSLVHFSRHCLWLWEALLSFEFFADT